MDSTIPRYKEAFAEAFNCSKSSFKIKRYYDKGVEDKSCVAEYKGNYYMISSLEDLYDLANTYLTDTDMANYIEPSLVSEIMEDPQHQRRFYEYLLELVASEDYQKLNLILNIYLLTSEDFWDILYRFSNFELYGAGVVAAAKCYDLEVLKTELVQELIANGDEYLNQFDEGFFKEVVFEEDTERETSFFIYQVDYSWDN